MTKEQIAQLLSSTGKSALELHEKASRVRDQVCGNKVYLRGLIELSNTCRKNCFYCGIRASNTGVRRYLLDENEVLDAARFAWERKYGSVVIQSGERSDKEFTTFIASLLKKIHVATAHSMRITLSCGEQTEDTYQLWKDCGADRYLLRIETSNPDLYRKIHPSDGMHEYHNRIKALETLMKCGYQTGTGVMIGLPFQTLDDLVNDLLFFRSSGIHMVGMGPYIEHPDTPLFQFRNSIPTVAKRVGLSLNMIAILRLLMPDINIASTTALQTLDNDARAKGLKAGANVIMPNITPMMYKDAYLLYNGKTGVKDSPVEASENLEAMVRSIGCQLMLSQWGDPLKFAAGSSSN